MWHGKHSRLLTQEQIERIHQRSIDVLEMIGISVDFNKPSHCVDRLHRIMHWLAHHGEIEYAEALK